MYAINAFFSVLLLLGSVATIRVALSPARDKVVLWGMALFWGFNAVYQVIWPFPSRIVWWATLAFAVWMVASYHACALAFEHSDSRAWVPARKCTPLDPAPAESDG